MKFKSERERLIYLLKIEPFNLPWPSGNSEIHRMLADRVCKITRSYEAQIGKGRIGNVVEIRLAA